MNVYRILKVLLQTIIVLSMLIVATVAYAEGVLNYLTNKDGEYIGPSLEDNVVLMDTDKNGFVDVYEMRAFLELKHGKGYEKDTLDRLEATASGKSCSTPFSKAMYIDKSSKVEASN